MFVCMIVALLFLFVYIFVCMCVYMHTCMHACAYEHCINETHPFLVVVVINTPITSNLLVNPEPHSCLSLLIILFSASVEADLLSSSRFAKSFLKNAWSMYA